MRHNRVAMAIALIGSSFVMHGATWAHHSRAGFYNDPESRVTLHGTVLEFRWQNPHAYIVMQGAQEGDEAERWVIELGSPGNLTQRDSGWSHDVLRPGDEIILTTHPARDGRRAGLGSHILFADGRQGPYEFELDNSSPSR